MFNKPLDWSFICCVLAVCGFVRLSTQDPIQPIAQDDCPTCDCGGLHDDGPLLLKSGRTITVWIDPNGTMGGLSPAKTKELLLQGFSEFDAVCGLDFVAVDQKAGARLRIEFSDDLNVLGRAWSSGLIQLNSTRQLGRVETLGQRRIIQAVACHEAGHVLGLVHGGERNDIMHPDLGYHWSVDEIKTLQRKHGKPDQPFHPTDRVEKGNQLRSAVAKFESANESWKLRVSQRNQFAEAGRWDDVKRVQADVLQRLKLRDERGATVAKLHSEWWAINKKWNTSGVQGVVKL